MKKHWILFTIIALLLCGFANIAFAESQEFNIVNKTGDDIHDLVIFPSDSNDVGVDLLNGASLINGSSVRIVVSNYNPNIEYWDIKGKTCCGHEQRWQRVRLSSTHAIILYDEGKVAVQ